MTEDSKLEVKTMDPAWERQTIEKVLLGTIVEQRRKRRWGIFFKSLIFIYIFAVTFFWIYVERLGYSLPSMAKMQHTAVINIEGMISSKENASADNVISAMRNAFKAFNCKGIILRINSPGGTPVQARQIYNEIKRLKTVEPEFPIYAAIEDIATSGAYLIASAADKIYADETSLVGSIGVAFNSFGAVDVMKKLGVERRLYTAGEHKGMLDPFSPANPADVALLKGNLKEVHEQFIQNVKQGRGTRLKEVNDLYSGRFWTGVESKKHGLIDEFGDKHYIARQIFEAPSLIEYSVSEAFFERFSKKLGLGVEFFQGWLSGMS